MIVLDQKIPIKYSLHSNENLKLYFKKRWPIDINRKLKSKFKEMNRVREDLTERLLKQSIGSLYFNKRSFSGCEKP